MNYLFSASLRLCSVDKLSRFSLAGKPDGRGPFNPQNVCGFSKRSERVPRTRSIETRLEVTTSMTFHFDSNKCNEVRSK